MGIAFTDVTAPTPTAETLAAGHARIMALLDAGALSRAAALAAFDADRRAFDTWSALVHLRYAQDTTDPDAIAGRETADRLAPVATGHDVAVKRRLLADPDRAGLEAALGTHVVRLWETDVTTFEPVIAADLEEEARLSARYTALLAGAAIPFDGETLNLSALVPFAESPDRETRHRAEQARWAFFDAHAEELDAIYDDLVRLRAGMAEKLGYASYTKLGYRRLRRVDYDDADVARYRDEVATHVTPLVARLMEARRARNGWDALRFWDEALVDPKGNAGPIGDHDVLLERAGPMFDAIDVRLGACWTTMREGGFLDLKNRAGKAGGGFCTSFPREGATSGMPFIFANFNGTHNDIGVFTHEMGHAFQAWSSRTQKSIDCLWPTMEAAEINSMGLEFLSLPHIGALVADADVDRFRRMHLETSLAFLPYGVCVDHFQHEVYANPGASPAERHAMWQRLERRYMPWADYGDLAHPARGGRGQAKHHIYSSPFYYIDYTLALACAMQFWVRARADERATVDAYVSLCARGGEAPFLDLVRSAGLISPFEPGALADVVRAAEAALLG